MGSKCEIRIKNVANRSRELQFDNKVFSKNSASEKFELECPKCLFLYDKILDNYSKMSGVYGGSKQVVYSSDLTFLKTFGGYLEMKGMSHAYGGEDHKDVLTKGAKYVLLTTGNVYGVPLERKRISK